MSNRNFKVIIVGGSVAGLTLAHTFSRAGIDYILLESRDTISPQLGASIVIMPNGAMILDQMGLYDDMQKLATGLKRSFLRTEDGADITSNMSPQIVEQRWVYPLRQSEMKLS
jgi:FAD dependent monooxygenase